MAAVMCFWRLLQQSRNPPKLYLGCSRGGATMAYNLIASPSASLSHEVHLFCNSFLPPNLFHLTMHKNLNFPIKLHFTKPSLRVSSRFSLQELGVNVVSQIPNNKEKAVSSSKKYVWVNQKSRRAAKLREKSYDSRYASLLKIAECLNSCGSGEEEISSVLDVLGDNLVEQDVVVILNNMTNTETAPLVLNYFRKKLGLIREVILYNVTLKVSRKCKDFGGAEKVFDEMIERGVKSDNVTSSWA